jgi:hypothetical protein
MVTLHLFLLHQPMLKTADYEISNDGMKYVKWIERNVCANSRGLI